MSYATVVAGLRERLETVPGIARILDYEPRTIQTTPTLYILFDGLTRARQGGLTINTYRVLMRLCLPWLDAAIADQSMLPFVNAIPAAIDADGHLGGRLNSGMARITQAYAVDFVTVGGTKHRCIDFLAEVVEKAPHSSAI